MIDINNFTPPFTVNSDDNHIYDNDGQCVYLTPQESAELLNLFYNQISMFGAFLLSNKIPKICVAEKKDKSMRNKVTVKYLCPKCNGDIQDVITYSGSLKNITQLVCPKCLELNSVVEIKATSEGPLFYPHTPRLF